MHCGFVLLASLLAREAALEETGVFPRQRRATRRRHGGGSGAIGLLLLMAMFGCTAGGDESVCDIGIPSMNAAEGLNRLAEQAGSIMLFPYDRASTRRANAVRGRYTLLEGLELLLEGTGLSGGLSDKRVVNISPSGNLRPGEEPPVVNGKPSLEIGRASCRERVEGSGVM